MIPPNAAPIAEWRFMEYGDGGELSTYLYDYFSCPFADVPRSEAVALQPRCGSSVQSTDLGLGQRTVGILTQSPNPICTDTGRSCERHCCRSGH